MVFMSSCVSMILIVLFVEIFIKIRMFLCQYYSFNTTEDMITAGLHVTDLSLFDSSSNFLVHGTNQERELKAIVHRVGYISVYFNFYKSID